MNAEVNFLGALSVLGIDLNGVLIAISGFNREGFEQHNHTSHCNQSRQKGSPTVNGGAVWVDWSQ